VNYIVTTAMQDMHEVLLANDQLLIARSSDQVKSLSYLSEYMN
jgi:hypothetical protein